MIRSSCHGIALRDRSYRNFNLVPYMALQSKKNSESFNYISNQASSEAENKQSMELQITSQEIIKPSSPTPHNLRTYKLSVIDQINSNFYFSLILFYSKTNIESTSNNLKRSLSNTLTYYYPLAGRSQDDFSVDCDDYGATFIEAHTASKMSEVLRQPEIHLLEKLLPFKPHERSSTHLNLSVQVNYFSCGGMAIGICFKHYIIDAASAGHFVKSWAAVACGANDVKDVISDNSSVFPPQDLSGGLAIIRKMQSLQTDSITKRFIFDGPKIASLREEIENGTGLDRPTRFEVVSAIILGAVIAAFREGDVTTAQTNLAARIAVNLRPRMNPPFPPQCMGNLISTATINWSLEKKVDYSSLVGELRHALRMVDDQYARKLFGPGSEFINFLRNGDHHEEVSKTRVFCITSLCRFPFYETDFGWGKPMWVSTGMRQGGFATLLDCCKGEGIEAWVGLPKEDMDRFEKDPSILQYASF